MRAQNPGKRRKNDEETAKIFSQRRRRPTPNEETETEARGEGERDQPSVLSDQRRSPQHSEDARN